MKKTLRFLGFSLYTWKPQTKQSSTPGISQICLTQLEISRPNTRTHGNSTWLFLNHPWEFNFSFIWCLEFPFYFFFSSPVYSMSSNSLLGFFCIIWMFDFRVIVLSVILNFKRICQLAVTCLDEMEQVIPNYQVTPS